MKLKQDVERMEAQALSLLNQCGYGTACNPSTSGEIHAIRHALSKSPSNYGSNETPIIFDVGAYHGEYLETACAEFPGEYHCFEPDKVAYDFLMNRVGEANNSSENSVFKNSRIVFNNFALADVDGKQAFYTNELGNGLNSLYLRELDYLGMDHGAKETEVDTMRLNTYMSKHRIDSIDLLKMDIEGAEYVLLSDAEQLIEQRRIKHIQWEFGGACIDSCTFMKDYYTLLRPAYNIYRIHPKGLILMNDYKEFYEIFQPVNYLAELI